MVAEEGLPWSAGCCRAVTNHHGSQVTLSHLPKGRLSYPRAGLLALPGECGEQVPAAAPASERMATPSLPIKLLTAGRDSRRGATHPARSVQKVFASRPTTPVRHGARSAARVVVLAGGRASAAEPL